MKPNELKIGNIFSYHGAECFILELRRNEAEFGYFTDSIGFTRAYSSNDFPTPIPITKEYLIKFGFKQFEITREVTAPEGWRFSQHLELQNVGGGFYRLYKPTAYASGSDNTHIRYVHELQNLVFTLAGLELTPYEKQQTALQQAMAELQKEGEINAIRILTKFLPLEYEQLEKAYKNGWDFGYKHVSTPAKTYIDNTYNTLK
jgi:hypothetical protein